ncbi:putative outer membrane protein [Paraburkholderia sp. BL8N3]|nr:DUF4142 domain-containing protein [Paraburkholderia sp. BL8N3]TCK33642.1 putative outer membrane protein [Paraburkholderia sp. BL8N3]
MCVAQATQEFLQAASMSSSTEIDAAKLVETRSTDKDVKNFARRMAVDHTKLTAQLKMAAPRGVTVPKDNSDTAGLDSPKGLRGKEFDIAYIQQVALASYKKAVEVFRSEASGGQNADLKKAAQTALPTSEEHLRMAEALATKKGVTAP